MPMNAATRIANDDVFCEADAVMDRIKKQRLSTTSMTLSGTTRLVDREGNEMLRSLLQGVPAALQRRRGASHCRGS